MNTNPAGYTYSDYLTHQDNELYHYGVKGMKWGVRRIRDRISQYRQARTQRKNKNRYDLEYRENRRKLEDNDSKYNDLDWKFRNQYDLESERAMRRGLYLGDDVPYSKKLKSLEKSLDDRGKFLDKKAHEITTKQMNDMYTKEKKKRQIKALRKASMRRNGEPPMYTDPETGKPVVMVGFL